MSPPFQAKGNIYLGVLEYTEQIFPGGVAALKTKLPPNTAAFFNTRFLAASWYDCRPLAELSPVAGITLKKSVEELSDEAATFIANRDMTGVYKLILKMASPHMIIERVPRLANQYFDFVVGEMHKVGDKHYETKMNNIPEFIFDQFRWMTTAFLRRSLTAAGAKNLTLEVIETGSSGQRDDTQLKWMRRKITWT